MVLSPATISLKDVSLASREGRRRLDGIQLTIPAGTHWAIVGPNGAGKTSLLRVLTGQLAPSRGTILFDGLPLSKLSLRQRAVRMAVVAQNDHPDLRLTLRDYVGLGRIPHRGLCPEREHRAAVDEALVRLGLTGLAARSLATLSGGERQRGALARALAQQPSVLVLDEPTNHLDPRARADLLSFVRDLGITVVAVLHDLPLVAPFADNVAVLRDGRVVVQGPPTVALAPIVVRDVFGVDSFEAVNPGTGRPVLVFEAPSPPERTEHAPSSARGLDHAGPWARWSGHRLPGDGR